jgi:hypothetical protein
VELSRVVSLPHWVSNMPLYPYANVKRRGVPQPGGVALFSPAMLNVRPEVNYPQGPHEAPDPIRQSDWNWTGKPSSHTDSRVPVVTAFNFDSSLSIEEEEFRILTQPRTNWTGTPNRAGGQNNWAERTNVGVPPAIAYGSLFLLNGDGLNVAR